MDIHPEGWHRDRQVQSQRTGHWCGNWEGPGKFWILVLFTNFWPLKLSLLRLRWDLTGNAFSRTKPRHTGSRLLIYTAIFKDKIVFSNSNYSMLLQKHLSMLTHWHQIDFSRWKDEDESDDEGGAEEGRLTINLFLIRSQRQYNVVIIAWSFIVLNLL